MSRRVAHCGPALFAVLSLDGQLPGLVSRISPNADRLRRPGWLCHLRSCDSGLRIVLPPAPSVIAVRYHQARSGRPPPERAAEHRSGVQRRAGRKVCGRSITGGGPFGRHGGYLATWERCPFKRRHQTDPLETRNPGGYPAPGLCASPQPATRAKCRCSRTTRSTVVASTARSRS